MKRLFYLVIACLVAGVTLFGCSGEDDNSIVGKWSFSYTKDVIISIPGMADISANEGGLDISTYNEIFDGAVVNFKADETFTLTYDGYAPQEGMYSTNGNAINWSLSQMGDWTFKRSGKTLELNLSMAVTVDGINAKVKPIFVFNKI